jgi:hypothetical protein
MMALLGRLPGAVFVIVGMLVAATLLRMGAVKPADIGLMLGDNVSYLLSLAIVLMPYGAAIAGLLAVVYLVTHHHEGAIAASISAGALIVLDLLWHVGLGAWITDHLTGKA